MRFETQIQGLTVYADSLDALKALVAEFGKKPSPVSTIDAKQAPAQQEKKVETPAAVGSHTVQETDAINALRVLRDKGRDYGIISPDFQRMVGVNANSMNGLKLAMIRLLKKHQINPDKVFKTYGNRNGRYWAALEDIETALITVTGGQTAISDQ